MGQQIVLMAVMKIRKYVQNKIVTTSLIEQYVLLETSVFNTNFCAMGTKFLEKNHKTGVIKILMKMKKCAWNIVEKRNSNLFVRMDMVVPCVQMEVFAL